jgi:heme-degrading monooxygenase HmoA
MDLPVPPYYAVLFSSQRTAADPAGYEATAQRMVELASQQPGFLGVESARNPDGTGITISYWRDLESIRSWRNHAEHLPAQQRGKSTWYSRYRLQISRVESSYDFDSPNP